MLLIGLMPAVISLCCIHFGGELGTKLYSQDNDSLGGFISEKLDRIPKAGDKLTIDNVWLFVERSSVNRAESVILKIQPDNKDTNDR